MLAWHLDLANLCCTSICTMVGSAVLVVLTQHQETPRFANHWLLVGWCYLQLHTPGVGGGFVVALAQSWRGRDLSLIWCGAYVRTRQSELSQYPA